jgi:hypothetical protein
VNWCGNAFTLVSTHALGLVSQLVCPTECNSGRSLCAFVQHHRLNPFTVSVLDHRCPAAENRHAVVLHQGSVLLAANMRLLAHLDQVIESSLVKARTLAP